MSGPITDTCKVEFDRVMHLVRKCIEVCPEDLWCAKDGGFYFWQQIYHALAHLEFFSRRDYHGPRPLPYPLDVVFFANERQAAPSKTEMLALAANMQTLAHAYMDTLSPHEITAPNEVFSAIVERPVNHLVGLMKFTAHTLYHLGCCDTLLRQRGLPGVY